MKSPESTVITEKIAPHEQIIDLIMNKDDISWQQIIFSAVKSEEMDPWDIDIIKLSQSFLAKLRELKEMDFKVSGKVILAAAIMLRIKSTKLIGEDLTYLDQLIASSGQSDEDAFYDELASLENENKVQVSIDGKNYELIPRTPQPRKRKVSVFDLVEALEKALEVKNRRRLWEKEEIHMEIPKKKIDIEHLIVKTFGDVLEYFNTQKDVRLTFSKLLKAQTKEEKVLTFIPLLHLSNSGKVNLSQEVHLGEIFIAPAHKTYERENKEEKEKIAV
jgi:segregation and condensation protein A